MVLDECPEYPVSHEYARQSMQRTVRWACQANRHFLRRMDESPTRHALFPIVQGSMFPDLRRECATELADLDTDGYAIGGLPWANRGRSASKWWKPPEEILPRCQAALRNGCRDAGGTARICGARHRHDGLRPAVTQRAQRIPVYLRGARDHQTRPLQGRRAAARSQLRLLYLQDVFRAYLRHLFQASEILYSALATRHNIQRYLDIMREIRHAITNRFIPEYLRCVRSALA